MVYKLYYFDIQGLAEPIRLLFSYGDIEFEDHRITDEEWPSHKSSMPMGCMPVLEIDGHRIDQSLAICRFLANEVGLAGKTNMENFVIDSIVNNISDLMKKIGDVAHEEDEKIQQERRKTLNEVSIPFFLSKFEEIAKENNGHLALNRLTWADLYFYGLSVCMNYFAKQDLTANYPNLKKVYENTAAIENIKKWIDKRPKSDY